MGHQRHLQTKTAAQSHQEPAKNSARPHAHPVEELQAAIGNRAVSRQIQAQRQSNPPAPIQAKPQFAGLSGSMAAHLPQSGTPIQAKLTLGAAGDRYEREADRIAADVASRLNAPTTEVAGERHTAERPQVPAQQLQKKPALSSLSAGEGAAVAPEVEASIQGEKGSGHSLAKPLREKMEQAFGGADFSGVRVHAGAESDRLNRSLNARAFTAGQDIFFRQGEYNPSSQEGQKLITHELVHVQQQNPDRIQRAPQQNPQPSSSTPPTATAPKQNPQPSSSTPPKVTVKGGVSSSLSKIAFLLDTAMPSPGDKCKLEVDLEVPLDGAAFIGFNLTIEGERKSNKSVSTEMKFLLTGGAGISDLVKLKGKLGGYVKAEGKDSKNVMALISYGFYRRLRESSAVPREITNKMWGDQASAQGYEQAEKWAAGVEISFLESKDDEDLYVETGGAGALEGEGGVSDVAKIGGELEFTSGRLTNKQSIKNLKLKKYRQQKKEAPLDQADINNPSERAEIEKALAASAPTGRGAQKKSGEGVIALKGTAKVDANVIGGEASLKFIGQSKNREKLGTGTLSKSALKYHFKGWEVELIGKATVPLQELTGGTFFLEKVFEWLAKAKAAVGELKNQNLNTLKQRFQEQKIGLVVGEIENVMDIGYNFKSGSDLFKPEIKLPDDPEFAQLKTDVTLEITGLFSRDGSGSLNRELSVRIVNVRGVEAPVIKALVEQKKLVFQF